MKTYNVEFTLEGGAEIEADSYEEALVEAEREAVRQYGRMIAFDMDINVEEKPNI